MWWLSVTGHICKYDCCYHICLSGLSLREIIKNIFMNDKKFYRYDISYSNSEEETSLILHTFRIISETLKGYWIGDTRWNFKKWVPKEQNAHKQYAWEDKDRAMVHLINRNCDRRKWYKYWTRECTKAIKIGKEAKANWLTDQVYIYASQELLESPHFSQDA